MTPDDAWIATLGQLELQLHRSTFDTWVRDCSFVSYVDGVFTIGVRNAYVRDWVEHRLGRAIKHTLSVVLHAPVDLNFLIQTPKPMYFFDDDEDYWDNADTLPLHNQSTDNLPQLAKVPKRQASLIGKSKDENNYPGWETGLNAHLTFENFVVGHHNQMAHAAAQAVVHSLGQAYNPLYIYSDVGLGKTHLLQAIGNACVKKGLRVIYTTAEQFTNQLVEAIRHKSNAEFRERYRCVDILIMDEIQFLSGKASSQEEFFHTFNTLHSQGKQIILSGDRHPQNIAKLEDRLLSRLIAGLTVEMMTPSFETSVALIQEKAEIQGHHLPVPIAEFIAHQPHQNIRDLVGMVTQVLAFNQLLGNRLTVEMVEQIIAQLGRSRDITAMKRQLNLDTVIKTIAEYEQLSLSELTGKSRTRGAVQARQIVIYFAREETNHSLPEIGEALGGRNHSTVIYNYNKIVEEMKNNPELRGKIEDIRSRIYHTG